MPLNITYLDDEPDICEIFAENFSTSDVKIKTFTDPEEAIQDIAAHPPDLVFLDFRLPNTNGDEVAKRLKTGLPKVLITADMDIHTTTKFIKKFGKPFQWSDIEAFIRNFQKELK